MWRLVVCAYQMAAVERVEKKKNKKCRSLSRGKKPMHDSDKHTIQPEGRRGERGHALGPQELKKERGKAILKSIFIL